MAAIEEIRLFDLVELREPVGKVPVGATGGVLELHDGGQVAMVEFTSMPGEPAFDRIEFVPLSKLRVVRPHVADSSGAGAQAPQIQRDASGR